MDYGWVGEVDVVDRCVLGSHDKQAERIGNWRDVKQGTSLAWYRQASRASAWYWYGRYGRWPIRSNYPST